MPKNTSKNPLSQFSVSVFPSVSTLLPCSGLPVEACQGLPGCPEPQGGREPVSPPPQIVNFGIDTLDVTFDTECTNGNMWTRLKEAKSNLRSSDEQEIAFKFLENGSDCMTWNLQRSGSKWHEYVLVTGDIRLGLSPRKQGSAIPNMALHVGSMSCQKGLKETIQTFKFWLPLIGIRIIEEKVSRVDPAVDVKHDIRTGEIDQIDNYISRARKQNLFHTDRKFNAIVIGSGDIQCRMYDKPLEMSVKGDAEKYVFFHDLWQVPIGTPITRVEFQLRRTPIKEFFTENTRIDTILDRLSDLWQYLVNDWLRHSCDPVDRENNNQSRAKNSDFWNYVVAAGRDIKEALARNRKQIHVNIPALRRQVTGIMTTILAALGHPAECFFEIIDTIQKIVAEDIGEAMAEPGFMKKYVTKQTRAIVSF
jgi:hypothetical protein